MPSRLTVAGLVLMAAACAPRVASAQSESSAIDLVVHAGRPIRVALDERVKLQRVGQPVTGTVLEPVYAYDRVVVPVGTKMRGHIVRIDSGSTFTRARAYATGNFSPPKQVVLQFDTLVLGEGRELPIDTIVKGGIPHVTRQFAGGSPAAHHSDGDEAAVAGQAAHVSFASRTSHELKQKAADGISEAKQKAHDAMASVREPGQLRRLREAAVQSLPYHPQYLVKGTVYDAELSSALTFGHVAPTEPAPAGTAPAPDSILTARLATTLDSAQTPKGTPFEAVITEPVFSADHHVVLPEGTKLSGEVTLATRARRFHRNGQLRFLFERVEVPGRAAAPLLGELHAVDASADDHVAVDEEGGATLENSKTRFIAPALSLLALRASVHHDGERHPDPDGDGTYKTAGNGVGARGFGGFLGMNAIGAVTGMVARPLGIALSAYGAARTVYANVLAKGREVTFAADTPIQVRLAPVASQR